MLRAAFAAGILSSAVAATAEEFALGFPADCTLGDTCYLQQFVDHDPSAEHSDFTCGGLTYNDHKGTDIALPTREAMRTGVNVLAAASGTVIATRDGMPDTGAFTPALRAAIDGRDCGNGLVIDHGNGWRTQYCHMASNSLTVSQGDEVEQGAVLGRIGLSGRTEFPHLHLTVRKDGKVIDPFDVDGSITCEAPSTETLWADPVPYVAGGLLTAGWSSNPPKYNAVRDRAESASSLAPNDTMLLWTFGFGSREGDAIRFRIIGPQGIVMENRSEFQKSQAQFMRYAGRRAPEEGWSEGSYDGVIEHMRGDEVVATLRRTIEIANR